jgi:hypothetical protein
LIGSDAGGTITRRIVSSGTLATMTLTGVSGDFTVGETITEGTGTDAATAEVVTWTSTGSTTGTLTLKYVSKTFDSTTPASISGNTSSTTATIGTVAYSGDNIDGADVLDVYLTTSPTYATSQRKIRVAHSNHGMHSPSNNVTISGVISEVSPTFLTASISDSETSITVNDASAFHRIINGAAVDATNPGFIKIEDEIISYSAFSNDNKTITVLERGADDTTAVSHEDETVVECYNLDSIPLTAINKTHNAISNPTLDTYEIGLNYIGKQGIVAGGEDVYATQNVQFETISPSVQKMLLPGTDVTARASFVTGTSIGDGGTTPTETSFSSSGILTDITLSEDNYVGYPALICSPVNEFEELSGGKSFRMDLTLTSNKSTLSPVIDMDRMSLTTISNRINWPTNTNSSKLITGDEHNAVYITRVADLTNPSKSIRVEFTGYRPPNTEIVLLYRVRPIGSLIPLDQIGYEFFPTTGDDVKIPATSDVEIYQDYQYEVSGLNFDQYQIKVLFKSYDQSQVPIIKDIRCIALAV